MLFGFVFDFCAEIATGPHSKLCRFCKLVGYWVICGTIHNKLCGWTIFGTLILYLVKTWDLNCGVDSTWKQNPNIACLSIVEIKLLKLCIWPRTNCMQAFWQL